mmetsp:Transcript_20958/g.37129  ORF Transcript_20958/g.37129 Transcript_20958/m.37129 type:complete len:204 (-) Transcript_20958:249-860(-)
MLLRSVKRTGPQFLVWFLRFAIKAPWEHAMHTRQQGSLKVSLQFTASEKLPLLVWSTFLNATQAWIRRQMLRFAASLVAGRTLFSIIGAKTVVRWKKRTGHIAQERSILNHHCPCVFLVCHTITVLPAAGNTMTFTVSLVPRQDKARKGGAQVSRGYKSIASQLWTVGTTTAPTRSNLLLQSPRRALSLLLWTLSRFNFIGKG